MSNRRSSPVGGPGRAAAATIPFMTEESLAAIYRAAASASAGARLGAVAAAVSLVFALVSTAVSGEELTLRDGSTFTGEVTVRELTLTVESGEVVIPTSAIHSLRAQPGGGVSIELVDGETIEGAPAFDTIPLQDGLIVRRVDVGEIELLTFPRPPAEEEIRRAGDEGRYLDLDRLETSSQAIEVSCPLRLEAGLPSPPVAEHWTLSRSRRILCGGLLSVSSVLFELREKRDGVGHLDLGVNLRVLPPQDQLARVRAELVIGEGKPIVAGRVGVDAEEGRITTTHLRMTVGPEAMLQWRGGAEARLRLEVDSVDN